MSVDWEDEGGFSCGGAVTASKKLKKGDGGVAKQEDAKPAPRTPKSLLFIPPNRRPKVLTLSCFLICEFEMNLKRIGKQNLGMFLFLFLVLLTFLGMINLMFANQTMALLCRNRKG